MLTKTWFTDDRARFTTCLEAVLGYYGVEREVFLALKGIPEKVKRVFGRLLTICQISFQTMRELTGWNQMQLLSCVDAPQFAYRLTAAEKDVVAILIRHIMLTVGYDEELPPEECDRRHELYRLRDVYDDLHQHFTRTVHGNMWYIRYYRASRRMHGNVDIIFEKLGILENGETECWEENPENDKRLWECYRDFAVPVDWDGMIVFLARGYKMALGLSDHGAQVFNADGRVVLLRGKSAYLNAPPAKHCLIFLTAHEARRFVYAHDPEQYRKKRLFGR